MSSLLISFFLVLSTFSKGEFYEVFSKNDEAQVNSWVAQLEKSAVTVDRNAYLGAILMKSADFQKNAKYKLGLFKRGKELLEAAILKSPENCEYRFLRMIIQENAPKVVKYASDLKEDAAFVKKRYSSLDATLVKSVVAYSKKSAYLKL